MKAKKISRNKPPPTELGIALTQYSLKAGIRVLCERGENAVVKELRTIHDMDTFTPVDAANMTWEERKAAVSSLMLLKKTTTATSKDEPVPTEINIGNI